MDLTMTRRTFVGEISASAFFSFDLLADTAGVELTGFALAKKPSVGIRFALVTKDGNTDGWKLLCMPKRECRYHELVEGASFPFPWDSKSMCEPKELKPVRKAAGRLEFFLPVADAKDFLTVYTFRGVCGARGTAMKDVSVAYLAKAANDTAVLAAAKSAYWSQGTVQEQVHDEWRLGIEKAYRMKETGTVVVEVDIKGVKPGKPLEIVAWGDNHLKLANDEDRKSDNIRTAFERRGKANPPEKGSQSLAREMELVPIFDGAAILGDNVDFFSYGSYELWDRMALDVSRDPLVVIGYHDYVTHTINKRPQKEMPPSVTMPVCKAHTPNDVTYATKLVGNRVLMIGLDASRNGNYYRRDGIAGKLAEDVKRARENGWTILIFQHEGVYLNTQTKGADGQYDLEADRKVCSRHTMTGERVMNYQNYASVLLDPKKRGFDQAIGTREAYEVIFNNADVIRGVFHGHVHANYASWIQAKTPDGKPMPIPQYSCNGSVFFDNGWVFRINVK